MTTKVKKFKAKSKTLPTLAEAIHVSDDDADIVGIFNLQVFVTQEKGYWFAQGLEIDYAAQGSTLEEVKANFHEGLTLTVCEHLKVFAGIEKLLVSAPPSVIREAIKNQTSSKAIGSMPAPAPLKGYIKHIEYLQLAA